MSLLEKKSLALICLFFLVGLSYPALASDAGAFLRIGVGARALGMGGAFVALADDATASYWNPAGLVQLKQKEVAAMYTDQFGLDLGYSFLAYSSPLKRQRGIALSWIHLSSGKIPRVELGPGGRPEVIGYFEDTEDALLISYSKRLSPRISLGANLKGVFHKLMDESASGWGLDLAALYRPPIKNLSLGLALKDLGTTLNWTTGENDSFPLRTLAGLAYRPFKKLTLCFDTHMREDRSSETHLGAEYQITPQFALRIGESNDNLTAGVGFIIARLELDYAYLSHELGDSHRFSLAMRF